MVELKLEPLDVELSKDFYVSVRVGEVQKLSRVNAGRAYKFPSNAIGERKFGKIEVFKKVGSCSVGILPETGVDQEVRVDLEDQSKVRFKVSVDPRAEKPVGVAVQEDKPAMVDVNPKVTAAKAYLEQHNLEMRLSEAMQAVLREKPEDPAAFVAERLAKSAGMVQKLPKVEEAASSQPSPAAPTAAPAATAPAASATPAATATPGAPQAASSQPAPAEPTAAPAATAPAASATPAFIATPGAPQANVAPAAAEVKEEKLLSEIPINQRWDAKPSVGTWAAHKRGPKLPAGAAGQ